MISTSRGAKRVASRIACALVGAACAISPGVGSADEGVTFTDREIAIILSHGPWPALGTALFFEPRLSGSGTKACASCHVPERNWTESVGS